MFWLRKIAEDWYPDIHQMSSGQVYNPSFGKEQATFAKIVRNNSDWIKSNTIGPFAKSLNLLVRGWAPFSKAVMGGGSNLLVAPVQATADKIEGKPGSWGDRWRENTSNNHDWIDHYYSIYREPTMLDELHQWAGEPHPAVDTVSDFVNLVNWARSPGELAATATTLGAFKGAGTVFNKFIKTPAARWANNKLLDLGYKDLASSVSKGRLRAAVPAR